MLFTLKNSYPQDKSHVLDMPKQCVLYETSLTTDTSVMYSVTAMSVGLTIACRLGSFIKTGGGSV